MLTKMYSTGIILLLTATLTFAAQIEGMWRVNKSNDVIEIRSTNNGIKAKFVDSYDWDHYEHLRKNAYEDRQGNRYILRSSDDLVWESRDGRKTLRLNRTYGSSKDRGSYGNGREDRYEDYDYRQGRNDSYKNRYEEYDNDFNSRRNHGRKEHYDDGYCSDECGMNCSMHAKGKFKGSDRSLARQLSGTWTNKWKNTIAYVEFDGFALQMKTNKSRKWTTYRRVHPRKLLFEDKFGNSVKFKSNGELEWKRSDNRREIEFRKTY